ncbi:MAG: hypothetical protein S4CHLAM20_04070 [Chlamydiia bacterium]|nr:hypothetical protein [Chlamydiia bacterium]
MWAVVGVVLTVLTMFGSVSLFFSNLNAKVVSLETKFEETSKKIEHIDDHMLQTDSNHSGLMERLGEMNGSIIGLSENMNYIKGKFELQDQIIMSKVLKGSKDEG